MIHDVTAQFPIPRVDPRWSVDPDYIDGIAIHHTVTFFPRPDATMEEELNHIRMIHEYHKWKGYLGFGYHVIVFPSGRAYYVVPLDQMGAHVYLENGHLYGIALVGDFTDIQPGSLQLVATAGGIAFMYGFLDRRVPIRGHFAYARPEAPTACPGATWPQWAPRLNALLEEEEEMELHYHTSRGAFALIGLCRHGLNGKTHTAAHNMGSLHGFAPDGTIDQLDDLVDLIDARIAKYASTPATVEELAEALVEAVIDRLIGSES